MIKREVGDGKWHVASSLVRAELRLRHGEFQSSWQGR